MSERMSIDRTGFFDFIPRHKAMENNFMFDTHPRRPVETVPIAGVDQRFYTGTVPLYSAWPMMEQL